MRTTALFIVSTLIILSFIGCNRVPSYDHRLVAVDSALAHDNPQEAKRLLDSIEYVSGSANRAYHALLQTESNYRNYIDDTTDAVINVALDYYESHQADRHNYVRALMYKGIISNLINKRIEAIKYLKLAETKCDTTDYYTLGYIKQRIADIYVSEYTFDGAAVSKYKEATMCFEKSNNKRLAYYCKMRIGGIYCKENGDSALILINEVKEAYPSIIEERCYFENLLNLALFYSNKANAPEKCKDVAVEIINNGLKYIGRYHPYYYASYSYAKLHSTDSAIYFYNKLPNNINDSKLNYYKIFLQSEIELSKHNYEKFEELSVKARMKSDSILTHTLAKELREVESEYDKTQVELEASELKNERFVLVIIVLLLLFCCGSIFVWQRQKRLQARAKINEILADYTCEKIRFEALAKNNSVLRDIASHHFQFIEQILQTINADRITPVKEVDRIHEMMNQYLKNNFDDGFWQKLETFVNTSYNNFCVEVRQKMPRVKDEDIHFLTLEIAQYPSLLILCLMNYTNIQSYHTKKARLKKRLQEHGLYERYEKCIVAKK